MRRFIVIVLFACFAGFSAKGQNPGNVLATVMVPHVIENIGPVSVPMFVDFDMGELVCSFDITITFDRSVIEFVGIGDEALANIIYADNQTSVHISWFDISGSDFSGKLLDLQFNYLGGYSDISFVSVGTLGVTEIGFCQALPIVASFTDGSISPPPAVPISNWSILLGIGLMATLIMMRRGHLI